MARVGFIVDDLVEDVELRVPLDRIGEAGHEVLVIGPSRGKRIRGKRGSELFVADRGIDEVDAAYLDALVIPGGYSPDTLRADERMVDLVRDIYDAGKPLAAVCHGPWMLAEADIADGLTLTSWPSIRTDLLNAGAAWVDEAVVEHDNVITSRNPHDLPAFCDAILRALENAASERAQPESLAELRSEDALDEGSTGAGFGQGRWRGGEGEGRPETHDLGGLQQREHLPTREPARRPANNEAVSEAEWLGPHVHDAAFEAGTPEGPQGPQDPQVLEQPEGSNASPRDFEDLEGAP